MNTHLYYAKFYQALQVNLEVGLPKPTLKRIVLLILGIYGARKFVISEIARELLPVKSFSASRKMLTRFFAEPIDTYRGILELFVRRIVEKVQDKKVVAVLDYTRVPVINLDVLFASIPLEGRGIPIYFEILFPWIIGKGSKNLFEVEFIRRLREIVPEEKDVIITWDRGFAKGQVLKRIKRIPGVYFVGRVKGNTAVFIDGKKKIIGEIQLQKGKPFSSFCLYGINYRLSCTLVGYWEEGMQEPWWILTNLEEEPSLIIEIYRERFWIEEGFRDLKDEFKMRKNYFRGEEKKEKFEKFLIACTVGYFLIYGLGLINKDKANYFVESSRKREKRLSYFFLGVRLLTSLSLLIEVSRLIDVLSLAGSLRVVRRRSSI